LKINNHVLIVDDDEEIHKDFIKILSPFRYTQLDKELANIEMKLFDEPPKPPSPSSTIHYQIDHAYRAERGLEMIIAARENGTPYALVFTDVRIPPGIDGVQLVRKILELAPDTQVVIVTAFSDYSWEEMTQFFGWTDRLLILRKPVDPVTVKQVAVMLTRKWSSEKELLQHQSDLEVMVEKRTAKLTATNALLQEEIRERQRAEEALKQAHTRLAEANQELQLALVHRKQTEEQLRVLLEELEGANRELENFAYIVSHDLKAPLRAISSIASWFHEDYGEILGKQGNGYLDDLQDQARWMHNLVEGILEYSRLGRAKYELKTLDSLQIVNRVVEVLNPPESISIVVAEDLPTLVYDRTHLEQVFQNLIGNAIKHMNKPEGRISITCEVSDEWFQFNVQDNGVGIDPRHFERIFKIFQTLKPREVAEDSTGIGLSLVRRIVERHEGLVWVSSLPGAGATFSFTISRALRAKPICSGNSVVVIDDNRDFCEVAETMLKRAGFKPLHAYSGIEALDLLAQYNGVLDLALLDLNLPGEDIMTLYPALKALRPDMRFLVCTGEPQSPRAVMLRRMGVSGMLIKPFNLEELNDALNRAFN